MLLNKEHSSSESRALAVVREPQPSINQRDSIEGQATEGVVAYWRIVVRHRWTVVSIALLGFFAAILLTLPQTPVYQTRATIEIQGINEDFLNFKNVNPNSSSAYVDPSFEILTQVKILQSPSLLERAMKHVQKQTGTTFGDTHSRVGAWRKLLHLQSKEVSQDAAVRAAAGSISVKGSGTNRLIEISCDATNPKVAAIFLNTLIDEFIQKNLEDRWKTTERTGEWLNKQLDELKVKLEKSEDALQAYAVAVGLQFTSGTSAGKEKDNRQESVAESTLRQLQQQLLTAKTERMAAQSKYELTSTSPAGALPQVLDDDSLHESENKVADLRRELAELNVTLSSTNPKIQRVQAQISELQAYQTAERSNVVTRIHNDYTAAVRREALLLDEFQHHLALVASQTGQEVHYGILRREVDTNRSLYESMLEKVKESGIASEMKADNFRIVDAAAVPGAPYKPNLTNNAMLGLMAGIFLGVVCVLLREQADRNIQQPGDCSFYLGIHELGVIPRLDASLKAHATQRSFLREEEKERVELVTWQRKRSLIAECFRTVLTSILFGESPAQCRLLVVASANPSEGKTTVASNLAIAFTEINQRVLLIDADMRRPRIHRLFGIENNVGLTDLLQAKQTLTGSKLLDSVHETWISGLHVLTSGPASANISTLLYSARLTEMIQLSRQSYDAVIIDTPPMLHIADARLLARNSDGVLLVVRAGKTTRLAAQEAKQKLVSDSTNILGTILVDWNPDSNGYGYNYKYYASHAAYYMSPDVGKDASR
jgi:succinoglycan biosynthesis transport protein ExoP